LLDAMITTAARYGYGGVSVARVVKQAGVSRATFYEHFDDKEDCFLVAFRDLAGRVAREVQRMAEDGRAVGVPREILARLLESADRDPAAAQVLLIEALAGGAAVRAEHERLIDSVEDAIGAYLDGASQGPSFEIPARSLLGGVGSVVAIRLFRGEAGRMIELLDDLEAWVASYAMPRGSGRNRADWKALGVGVATPVESAPNPLDIRLPRGRAALPSAVVASEQRQRVLAAVARVAREKGYAAMTVADIVATAGIARAAFYEQFRSKEDAFLSAQAFALENSLSIAASKFFSEESWPNRVWSGALAMLAYVASVPDLATLDFVESYTAGRAAIRRSFEGRMAYTLFLEEGYRQRPEAEDLPRLCSEAIAGAILELMRRQTVKGNIDQMQHLAPQAVYVALAPFIGPEAALTLIEEKIGRPIPRSP
jgi:AcrR family transcriptional regulator